MSFAPKRLTAFKISESDMSSLKEPSFMYLCLLVEKLQRIKVKALQNLEDFLQYQMKEFKIGDRSLIIHKSA